jgi:hypothetical protein
MYFSNAHYSHVLYFSCVLCIGPAIIAGADIGEFQSAALTAGPFLNDILPQVRRISDYSLATALS